MMDAKAICSQQLTHLSTAVVMGRRAPHKAVLLLAIMDLVQNGSINSPRIVLSKQLEEAFEKEWRRYIGVPLVFKCVIATPFWHMRNEPFYSLFHNTGEEIVGNSNAYSKKRLKEETYAVIDEDLYEQMQKEDSRNELRSILIDTYLRELHSDLEQKKETVLSLMAITGLFLHVAV